MMWEKRLVGVNEMRVFILAPTGKDAVLIQNVLSKEGLHAHICHNGHQLRDVLSQGVGMLLLAQEALTDEVEPLTDFLARQEAWSDIPITLLTTKGASYRTIHHITEKFNALGNLTLLERPLQSFVLVSTVRVALKSRQRQYQVRELLTRLQSSQSELQDKIADLEKFEQVVVGRELKMMKLEKQIQELHNRIRTQAVSSSGNTE